MLREDSLRAHRRPSLVAGTVLDRLDPIIDLSAPIRELTTDRRLLDAVETVLGEPARLFKDKAILKPPGAFGYRQHQDYTYWQELQVPAQFLMTALVAVDKSSAESGGLQLYPGLHHRHVGPEGTPSKIFSPDHGLIDDTYLEGTGPELIELNAGDVVLFCSLTPHCSEPNRSPHHRRSLFFSFSAASYGDQRENYYRNLHRYLRKDRREEASMST